MVDMQLYEAQQQLADAEAQHAARVHNEKIAELERLRTHQLEAEAEFHALEGALRTEDEQRIRIRHEVRNLQLGIGSHEFLRPSIQGLLPNDPVCRAWSKEHARLTAALADAEKRLRAVPQSDRLLYIRLGTELGQLEYAIQNAVDFLNGSLGKVPKSSLTGVA